jgi:glycerophosphoryl diester phosphodiesterase
VSCEPAGCGGTVSLDDAAGAPANLVVRRRIADLAPAANLGHRGTGVNRLGHPFAENSLASFHAAVKEGADGVELDVELTADGELIIMHDDTLDRTTTCRGCVSAFTFSEARGCALLDGNGRVTGERPPTLDEVFGVLPPDALVNIELKVYEPPCLTATTGARALARTAVAAVHRLGVGTRTLFSSFSEEAAAAVKDEDPHLYSAQLLLGVRRDSLMRALDRHLDAIHPLHFVSADNVRAIREAGLQVNVWTVDAEADMRDNLNKGVTAIITDEPGVLAAILAR